MEKAKHVDVDTFSGGDGEEKSVANGTNRGNDSGCGLAEECRAMREMGLPTEFFVKPQRKNKKFKKDTSGTENPMLEKYRSQKYRLFSKFDQGIILDTESWYSVTPEPIAKHIAQRCAAIKPLVIVDACCGAGGNTIQFALQCPSAHIIAVDIDPEKIRIARNNAEVYKVEDRIEFLIGDFMQIAGSCRIPADIVFLSPQWGGPEYLNQPQFSIECMTPNGKDLINVVRRFMTVNIALLLPRNANIAELQEAAGESGRVEIEKNLLFKKTKTMTAYFGDLIPKQAETLL